MIRRVPTSPGSRPLGHERNFRDFAPGERTYVPGAHPRPTYTRKRTLTHTHNADVHIPKRSSGHQVIGEGAPVGRTPAAFRSQVATSAHWLRWSSLYSPRVAVVKINIYVMHPAREKIPKSTPAPTPLLRGGRDSSGTSRNRVDLLLSESSAEDGPVQALFFNSFENAHVPRCACARVEI